MLINKTIALYWPHSSLNNRFVHSNIISVSFFFRFKVNPTDRLLLRLIEYRSNALFIQLTKLLLWVINLIHLLQITSFDQKMYSALRRFFFSLVICHNLNEMMKNKPKKSCTLFSCWGSTIFFINDAFLLSSEKIVRFDIFTGFSFNSLIVHVCTVVCPLLIRTENNALLSIRLGKWSNRWCLLIQMNVLSIQIISVSIRRWLFCVLVELCSVQVALRSNVEK